MAHLYVYYSVETAKAAALRSALSEVQRQIGGQVRRRVDTPGERETWMEIYEHVSEDFESRLAAACAAAGIPGLIAGARHVERFDDF